MRWGLLAALLAVASAATLGVHQWNQMTTAWECREGHGPADRPNIDAGCQCWKMKGKNLCGLTTARVEEVQKLQSEEARALDAAARAQDSANEARQKIDKV